MVFGVHLPFQRRRTRWERFRDAMLSNPELMRRLEEARRWRDTLPDRAELARRAQPLMDRVAAAGYDFNVHEPAFLQGRLGLLEKLNRQQPSTKGRIAGARTPLWLTIGMALGAFSLGFIVGAGLTGWGMQQAAGMRPEDLEAAADQIKERWPAIHDDDIREANGNLKRLSTVVAERTGENARAVRERIAAMTTSQSANGQS
ncbi:MAG: hypothetical protein ACRDJE_19215 [Dehalococcoidia bacterium]